MVAQRTSLLALLFAALSLAALVVACNKVPLLAPTGSVITLLPESTTASLNSHVTIVATVIENGTAQSGSGLQGATTRAAAGTPVQNGTLVTFTTTVGQIQPSEATTHNGQVTVNLVTGSASGTAHITAYSGGASTSVDLPVGTAGAKTITVAATPQGLGSSGGTSQIVASVLDQGGSPIAGVPVTFSTDKGSVSPATVVSDSSGSATTTLSTTGTATVTATAGGISGKTTVTVNAKALSSFTTSGTGTVGTPITFTVTPTAGTSSGGQTTPGANLTNVRVNFGDGDARDLGAISSATTVSHVYNSPGNFTATATAVDATGESSSVSTTVSVGALQVSMSATPNPATVGSPITFNVQGTTNAVVGSFLWTFDDGTQQTTSGPQNTHTFTSRGIHNARVDVIGINGAVIGTAPLQISVQ